MNEIDKIRVIGAAKIEIVGLAEKETRERGINIIHKDKKIEITNPYKDLPKIEPIILQDGTIDYPDGRANRRKRREEQRKNKKK